MSSSSIDSKAEHCTDKLQAITRTENYREEQEFCSLAQKALQPPSTQDPELKKFMLILNLVLHERKTPQSKNVAGAVEMCLDQLKNYKTENSNNESSYRMLYAQFLFMNHTFSRCLNRSTLNLDACIEQLEKAHCDQATSLSCLAYFERYRIKRESSDIRQAHLLASHCRVIETNSTLFDFIALRYVESLLRENKAEQALEEARQFAGTFTAQYCNLVMLHSLRIVQESAVKVNKELLHPLDQIIDAVPKKIIPGLKQLLKGLRLYAQHMFAESSVSREQLMEEAAKEFDIILDCCSLTPEAQSPHMLTLGLHAVQLKSKIVRSKLAGCSMVPPALHQAIISLVRVYGICLKSVHGRLTLYRRLIPEKLKVKLDKPLFDFELHTNMLDWYVVMKDPTGSAIMPMFWKARVEELWPSLQPRKVKKLEKSTDMFAACDAYCRMIERVSKEHLDPEMAQYHNMVQELRRQTPRTIIEMYSDEQDLKEAEILNSLPAKKLTIEDLAELDLPEDMRKLLLE